MPLRTAPAQVFPRPPTMCVACPHLGVYYTLSQVRNPNISGDIGCYTLGAGHPVAGDGYLRVDGRLDGSLRWHGQGRGESDKDKRIVAVIGDSTFLHMGMQGLLDMVYNKANVTVMLLDNRAICRHDRRPGQPGQWPFDIYGDEAPRVDFANRWRGARRQKERIHVVNPTNCRCSKTIRDEVKVPDVSGHHRPALRADQGLPQAEALRGHRDQCTGCGNFFDVGCPAIHVTRRARK